MTLALLSAIAALMHPWTALGFLGGLGFGAWFMTRHLRKSWYGRGAIEIVLALVLGLIVAIGALGAWYDRTHIDVGEAE